MQDTSAQLQDRQDKLKEIWKSCFSRIKQGGLTQQEQSFQQAIALDEWNNRAQEHLPLTLEIMELNQPIDIKYGREGRRESCPDGRALLITWGFSPEQVALGIAIHAKREGKLRVYPFTTKTAFQKTLKRVNECLQILGIENDNNIIQNAIYVESNSPASVFQKIAEWLRDTRNQLLAPAIDCTGGQKPMDAGASYAASFYDIPDYYLDFSEYDQRARRPKPWTSRYHRLPLPDATFSFGSRRKILNDFCSHNYAFASQGLRELVESSSISDYLDAKDQADLREASAHVEWAANWMDVRYERAGVATSPKLHTFFRAQLESKKSGREIVEALISDEDKELALEYIVDEYWRLWLLRKAKKNREALIGCAGLVELTVDALFPHKWFESTAKILEITGERISLKIERTPFQSRHLFKGNIGGKLRLFYGNTCRFDAAIPHGAKDLDGIKDKHDKSKNDTEISLLVTCDPLIRLNPSMKLSKGKSDNFWGRFHQGQWFKERHGLVHIRAPFHDPRLLSDALGTYVPRFIELLYRVVNNIDLELEQIVDPQQHLAWITWWNSEKFRQETRIPWDSQQVRETLADWLRLPSTAVPVEKEEE
jgi:hypothetical protein